MFFLFCRKLSKRRSRLVPIKIIYEDLTIKRSSLRKEIDANLLLKLEAVKDGEYKQFKFSFGFDYEIIPKQKTVPDPELGAKIAVPGFEVELYPTDASYLKVIREGEETILRENIFRICIADSKSIILTQEWLDKKTKTFLNPPGKGLLGYNSTAFPRIDKKEKNKANQIPYFLFDYLIKLINRF